VHGVVDDVDARVVGHLHVDLGSGRKLELRRRDVSDAFGHGVEGDADGVVDVGAVEDLW